MTKSIIKNAAEVQAWETYARAKNKRDLMWEKLTNYFTLIPKGHEIDGFKDKWSEFSKAEFECRNAFDDLQYIAKK